MSGSKIITVVILIIIVIIGFEVIIHRHSSSAQTGVPSSAAVTAVNDCIALCQAVYDGASTTQPPQEQACENTCYKSAGLTATTSLPAGTGN